MKNVTITMDEEVARWLRVAAAERDQSVSRFVGQLLRERMEEDERYEEAMRKNLRRKAKPLKSGGVYPTRDDLHDRPVLRRH